MASFEYKAKNGDGAVVVDVVPADTEAQAFDQLDRQGLFPIEIREKRHGRSLGEGKWGPRALSGGGVPRVAPPGGDPRRPVPARQRPRCGPRWGV